MGAMFMMNWVLTTKNNFKIAFHAGQDFDEYARHMMEIQPNIMIRHRIRTCSPAEYARQCEAAGVQYIMPWHHSNALITGEDLNAYFEEVNAELKKRGSLAKAFNPDPYQWYQLYLGIQTC